MKQEFVEALRLTPDSVQPWVIGNITSFSDPSTEAAATIATGKLAYNLNEHILKPLSGMDLTELLLCVGQHNSVLTALLLSVLEVISGDDGGLQILIPANNSVQPNYFEFSCTCSGKPKSINVTVDKDIDVDLTSKTGNLWKGQPSTPISTGKHSAIFTAVFEDASTVSTSTSFEATANMELVATFPEQDGTYQPSDITQVSVTLTEEAAEGTESLEAEAFGQVYSLIKSGATFAATVAEIGIDYVGENIMTVKNLAGEVLGSITFLINPPEAE